LSASLRHIAPFLLILCAAHAASQTAECNGQASGWISANPTESPSARLGLRYIPDLLAETSLGRDIAANLEFSLNAFATAAYATSAHPSYDDELKLYRAWMRVSTDRFETRLGLQKLNFGSALLFRPLMWFDRVDPRDPLQLTDGVYGLLARYYFQNNANIWLWGLLGNNDTKGWELDPTEKNTPEYGGRVQSPLWTGEIAITYHHRRADQGSFLSPQTSALPPDIPEDRLGLDGKWDIGIGIWFEGTLIRQAAGLRPKNFQRLWTVGADYTFSVGSGLYAATEYFRLENSAEPFGAADGRGLSGLSLSYPIGIVDQVSTMFFHDWGNGDWYRILTWQRKYDNWTLYLLGFWNPETVGIYPASSGSGFAGTGFQFMIAFNH
jgi:hypothetical protein